MSDEALKAHPEAQDGNSNLLGVKVDKVDEYFKLKSSIRALRADLKDIKDKKDNTQEIERLTKKIKHLRDEMKSDEDVKELYEKITTTKERMDLLKELIRIELLEKSQEEIERDGRKLKIVNILKEFLATNATKAKGRHTPHPDQINIFHPQAS
jgi:chromosome segregation ATPase